MKRLLLVCLIMTCSASYAEWEIYGDSEEFKSYLDKDTIRKNGAIVKIWELQNFVTIQRNTDDGQKYKSQKIYVANDCKSEMRSITSLISYEGEFGAGVVTYSVSVPEKDWNWRAIVPGSIGQSLWQIACGKK
jgi:hypothetical protein